MEKSYLGSNKAAGQKASPMPGIELNFLVGNFTNESISFSKGKEFNNWFDDWLNNVWIVFWNFLHERSSIGKNKGRQKCNTMEKFFNEKAGTLF